MSCSGFTSCSGRVSCPQTCSVTCPKPCSVSCPKPCSVTCPKPCPEPCSVTCPKPCSVTCPKPCSVTCPKPCSVTCPKPCSVTCPKPCSVTCPKPCSVTCPKPCSVTCPKPCSVTCPKPCSVTCPKPCYVSCPKPCPDTCPNPCYVTCPKPCSISCPKPCSRSCYKPCSTSCNKPCSTSCYKPCSTSCYKPCSTSCYKPCSTSCCPRPCPVTYSKSCSIYCPKRCPVSCIQTCPRPCSISCFKPCPKICSMTCPKICPQTCPKICSRLCDSKAPCGRKAYSVYGCGFRGTRISSCCTVPGSTCYIGCDDYLQQNEKTTMQNLNDRLASFLEKVRSLEASNCNLERQIKEYNEQKEPVGQRDFSCYWNTVRCLQEQIKDAIMCNTSIFLQIDNSKLAAEDFRVKYEHELVMRQSVEADICNLRCLLDEITRARADLEMQICSLQDEMACLKKNHQEDVAALLCQLSGKVCVEVDAPPQPDLTRCLDEIRCHYEAIIEKHRREQECWFREKTEQLCKEVACNTECMESCRAEAADMRRTVQCLEIDLQSQLSMKGALECSLAETESRYSSMLACFQNQIHALEAELCEVRASIEQQGRDYATLLNIKSCLEQEIATYKCLLENQDNRTQVPGGSPWVCSAPAICAESPKCKPQC